MSAISPSRTASDALPYGVEQVVRERYTSGARQTVPELCCPIQYEGDYLKVIPREIVERDYGCGDPSRWVGEGETVLDLGSGGGKICYILAQRVGGRGRVIGVDMNDEMLALARAHRADIAAKLGFDNVSFRKGRIQDLRLDLDLAQAWLDAHPVATIDGWGRFEAECERLRRDEPMVQDDSVDVVVSNCVLNLVDNAQKGRLFGELFRVLKRGGRAVISDIVCDEGPTPAILNDPGLWSGCIAGAFREDRFLARFEEAGFYGVEVLSRSDEPWRTIHGVEFRSMTVRAFKGKQGPCIERNQALVYRGPWKQVRDDDGHVFHRGERMAVCDKTYRIMIDPRGPYAGQLIPIDPLMEVHAADAGAFDCKRSARRDPRETKGTHYRTTTNSAAGPCCGPEGCC